MKFSLKNIHSQELINKIIKNYGFDKFVGEFQSPINGEISTCGMLFWTKEIAPEVYERVKNPNDVSNYAFVYYDPLYKGWMIRNGLSCAEKTRNGLITPNGDFIYSRHRHNYIEHDGCMIDGGDDYLRCSGKGKAVMFTIVDGEIKTTFEKLTDATTDENKQELIDL